MKEMKYKLALRDGFHDLLNMRDDYVLMKKGDLNPHLVLRFIEVQLLMVAPFASHFADYHWRNLFVPAASKVAGAPEYNSTVVTAAWPTPSKEYDTESSRIYKYIKKSKKSFSKMFTDMTKKGKKKKKKAAPVEEKKEYKHCILFYAENYLNWQEVALTTLTEVGFSDEFDPLAKPAVALKEKDEIKKEFKKAMAFASFVAREIKEERSLAPLELKAPFDENAVLEAHKDYIFNEMKMETVTIVEKAGEIEGDFDTKVQREQAVPGKPIAFFH